MRYPILSILPIQISSNVGSLQEQKAKLWGDRVHLIYGDMRKVEMPEQVDILVSELLGSFGDNEASPECLDGAMRFLKRKSTTFERVTIFHVICSRWNIHSLFLYSLPLPDIVLQTAQ